jgi:hypothetical protein
MVDHTFLSASVCQVRMVTGRQINNVGNIILDKYVMRGERENMCPKVFEGAYGRELSAARSGSLKLAPHNSLPKFQQKFSYKHSGI